MIRSDPNYAVSFLFRKAIHPRSRKAARVLLFAPKKQVYIDTGDGSFALKKHISDHVQKLLTGFAAGAMMYVVVEELIPEMSEGRHTNLGTIAFSLGFVLMMVLDVALG